MIGTHVHHRLISMYRLSPVMVFALVGVVLGVDLAEVAAQATFAESHTFPSNTQVAYPTGWQATPTDTTLRLENGGLTVDVLDFPHLKDQGHTPNSPAEQVLNQQFNAVVADTKQAFDPAALVTLDVGGRSASIYRHQDGTGVYRWAYVRFSNALYGVIRFAAPPDAPPDEALLLQFAQSFDNTAPPNALLAPPEYMGRAELGRQTAGDSLPVTLASPTTDITIDYPEGWLVRVQETGAVYVASEAVTMTLYGPRFLSGTPLADVPTTEELAQDAASTLSEVTIQSESLVKINNRPAYQVIGSMPEGAQVMYIAVTFSDGRLGLARIEGDSLPPDEVVYTVLDTFDVAPVDLPVPDADYVAATMRFAVRYPAAWTIEENTDAGFITVSNGRVAINVYGPAALEAAGLKGLGGPTALCEAVIAQVGWDGEPASRLRLDQRAAARLIYTNPVYEAEARLFAIILDTSSGALGYFDVVPLEPGVNVARYEPLVLDMLATFHTPRGTGT